MLTVGHAPREDLMPDMLPMLSPNIEVSQMGGLDGLSVEEARAGYLAAQGEDSMMTRLADGSMAALSTEKMLPRLQRRMDEAAEKGANAIVMLCTNEFPPFECSVPLLFPFSLLHALVPAIAGGLRVAAAFPFPPYGEAMAAAWAADGVNLVWDYAQPGQRNGEEIAALFREQKPDFLILDCIGYSFQVKREAEAALGIPVLQAKKLIASLLNCLFGS